MLWWHFRWLFLQKAFKFWYLTQTCCYTANPFPVMKTGVPAMRTGVPSNENRIFPVWKTSLGKPCSGPVLALYRIAVYLKLMIWWNCHGITLECHNSYDTNFSFFFPSAPHPNNSNRCNFYKRRCIGLRNEHFQTLYEWAIKSSILVYILGTWVETYNYHDTFKNYVDKWNWVGCQ